MPAPCAAAVAHRDLTLVFTDIVGSTRILAWLGEDDYLQALRRHNAGVRELTERHGGDAVKFLGDGWMLAFPCPDAALACAVACQEAADGMPIRIGIHTGRVLEEGGDLLGRDVVVASRLAGVAGPGEIAVSGTVHRRIRDRGRFDDGRVDDLRGLGPHRVFRATA